MGKIKVKKPLLDESRVRACEGLLLQLVKLAVVAGKGRAKKPSLTFRGARVNGLFAQLIYVRWVLLDWGHPHIAPEEISYNYWGFL